MCYTRYKKEENNKEAFMNIEKLIKQLGKALASMVMQEEVTMY
ncbi:hypothetical protein [Clostridium algidicarnis]|nr:hypothetical protein [Clostridium algidicarnis]